MTSALPDPRDVRVIKGPIGYEIYHKVLDGVTRYSYEPEKLF